MIASSNAIDAAWLPSSVSASRRCESAASVSPSCSWHVRAELEAQLHRPSRSVDRAAARTARADPRSASARVNSRSSAAYAASRRAVADQLLQRLDRRTRLVQALLVDLGLAREQARGAGSASLASSPLRLSTRDQRAVIAGALVQRLERVERLGVVGHILEQLGVVRERELRVLQARARGARDAPFDLGLELAVADLGRDLGQQRRRSRRNGPKPPPGDRARAATRTAPDHRRRHAPHARCCRTRDCDRRVRCPRPRPRGAARRACPAGRRYPAAPRARPAGARTTRSPRSAAQPGARPRAAPLCDVPDMIASSAARLPACVGLKLSTSS